jgi:hypothetical protein
VSARTLAQQQATKRLHENARARTAAQVEDMDFLVQCGVPHEEAAARAGWPSIHAAERALYRHGRPDLAGPLARMTWRRRRDG